MLEDQKRVLFELVGLALTWGRESYEVFDVLTQKDEPHQRCLARDHRRFGDSGKRD